MKILEIIHVRALNALMKGAVDQIRASLRNPEPTLDIITFYHRQGVMSDVAIHLSRKVDNSQAEPSATGLRIAASLRENGIVEHTVWTEM